MNRHQACRAWRRRYWIVVLLATYNKKYAAHTKCEHQRMLFAEHQNLPKKNLKKMIYAMVVCAVNLPLRRFLASRFFNTTHERASSEDVLVQKNILAEIFLRMELWKNKIVVITLNRNRGELQKHLPFL
jgi:hypothetical protein